MEWRGAHLTALEKSKQPTPRSKVPRPITCSVARLTESHTLTWGCRGCVGSTDRSQQGNTGCCLHHKPQGKGRVTCAGHAAGHYPQSLKGTVKARLFLQSGLPAWQRCHRGSKVAFGSCGNALTNLRK